MIDFLGILYTAAVAVMSLYGFLGLLTLALYWRHRHETFPLPIVDKALLPAVTVQLPIYNEQFVVERLIETAVNLDYPPEKLQIQVIDDSTDQTAQLVDDLVRRRQQEGVNISVIRRRDRAGYKAGALANALPQADGEFIAIFDADFAPDPQFLQETIPHFVNQPSLGVVQARWAHLNAEESALTGAQSIALDKHFVMEQTVRHRADLFPKFNGTGGVWRRQCMDDAGGWQADTVCEDLCLSTRAVLNGWEFRFLNDVTAPAELPSSITAYKSQQARWAKGSTQCLLKYGKPILKDSSQSPLARFYALFTMSGYTLQIFLLFLLLLQIPLLYADYRFSPWLLLFTFAGVGQPLLFILGQQVLYPDWKRRLRYLPAMLLIAIGMAPSNGRAILQAFFSRDSTFVRTPKSGGRQSALLYRMDFDWIVAVEIGCALYAAIGLVLIAQNGNAGPLFFLLTCVTGFSYVAGLSINEARMQ